MAKREIDIWDILFWIGMLVLTAYVIAKLFGWINTPEWVDLIPLITIIFIVGIFYQKVMVFMGIMYNRIDYMKKSVDKLSDENSEYEKRIFAIEKQIETFNKLLTIKRK